MTHMLPAASRNSTLPEPTPLAGSQVSTAPRLALHDRLMQWLASHAGDLATEKPWISRYGVALTALAIATVVRMLLDPVLENRAPYGCYLIAVLFVAWRAGLGPALVTVVCGTLLARYFFEVPRGSFLFDSEPTR